MSADRSEDPQATAPAAPAAQVRAVVVDAVRQWATYWRASAVLAWRTVFPPREDSK